MATSDDVRRIALSLPEAVEKTAWGMPTFRAGPGGRIFASLDDDQVLGVTCPREERAELIAAEPEKFFLREGHDDRYAWLRVRLAALDDEEELRAILADSWRQAARPRLRNRYPEVGRVVPEVGRAVPEVGRAVPEEGRIAPEEGRIAPEEGRAGPSDG